MKVEYKDHMMTNEGLDFKVSIEMSADELGLITSGLYRVVASMKERYKAQKSIAEKQGKLPLNAERTEAKAKTYLRLLNELECGESGSNDWFWEL